MFVNNCHYLDELPTLKELTLLKYTDRKREEKVSIISEASYKWKEIACLICDVPTK